MKGSNCWTATLHTAVLGLLFSRSLAQTATTELGAITTLGCYSSAGTLLKDNTDVFQTSGLCAPVCGNKGHAVMAIIGGSTCYCGDVLPALDQEVDKSKCNSPCQGFGGQMCGGVGYYQLYLTGLSGDVATAPNATSSSSSGSGTHAASSRPAETVVVTASSTAQSTQQSNAGPNKVGIAVGVVVGVIVMAAVAGGAIFYMKQKRRREIEEEHKANAAVNSFIGAKSDARLDPSVASSYRRESIGSIADERDFSRKILQVRNPDRGSMTSVA